MHINSQENFITRSVLLIEARSGCKVWFCQYLFLANFPKESGGSKAFAVAKGRAVPSMAGRTDQYEASAGLGRAD